MSRWPTHPISDLGRVTTGSTPSTSDENLYGGDTPFVTPAELDQTLPVVTAARTLSPLGIAKARLLPRDTVMVCCIGSLGKVGISGRTVATNQQVNSVEFDPTCIWPRYGFYACRLLKPSLELMAPATTVAIVNKSKFEKLRIPVPPLTEQRRIAEILDKADALRAKRRAALVQLHTLTQSIFFDMFGDPVTNSNGWPRKAIGEIGKVVTGNTPPRANPSYYGAAIEWIKSDNINTPHYYLTKADEGLSESGKAVARTVPAGSILVTCIAGSPECIGNAAMTEREVAFNQQINALVPNNGDADFLYAQILVGKRLIQEVSSAGMKGIVSKGRFEQIRLIFPPIELQHEFARRIAAVEKLAAAQRASLAELDALFACLQHRAFRGEL